MNAAERDVLPEGGELDNELAEPAAAEENLDGAEAEMTHEVSGDDADNGAESDAKLFNEEESALYEEYERRAESDLMQIRALYPHLSYIKHLGELKNAARFARLRELGLSVKEALLATNQELVSARRYDNRSHLTASVPRGIGESGSEMSRQDMQRAKEIFSGLDEKEIRELWKRVKVK